VQSGAGWIAATSGELDPLHPEKALLVRADFAASRAEEHVALVAALLEACEFCDRPENHEQIISVLARPEFVGVSKSALKHGISGRLDCGRGTCRVLDDFCIFNRDHANAPSGHKAAWALDLVRTSGLCPQPSVINFELGRTIFRADIFEQAVRLRFSTPTTATHESNQQLAIA
jgi:ABC-type nitrate/sulfonate/bicarbonate transport system substrate-binding protein